MSVQLLSDHEAAWAESSVAAQGRGYRPPWVSSGKSPGRQQQQQQQQERAGVLTSRVGTLHYLNAYFSIKNGFLEKIKSSQNFS